MTFKPTSTQSFNSQVEMLRYLVDNYFDSPIDVLERRKLHGLIDRLDGQSEGFNKLVDKVENLISENASIYRRVESELAGLQDQLNELIG